MSDGSLSDQVEILIADMCPQAFYPIECIDVVRYYWPELGEFLCFFTFLALSLSLN